MILCVVVFNKSDENMSVDLSMFRVLSRIVSFCVFISVFCLGLDQARAYEGLDIAEELSQPGVKLVVVEFYATWCKPCMKAVPKWKKLHDKYKGKGLRFIVVSENSDVCSAPPDWLPDKTICDSDGSILKRISSASGMDNPSLPVSFLYSWEGALAIMSHKVNPIDKAVKDYFENTHLKMEVGQIDVIGDKYAVSGNPEWLRGNIISQIREQSKFDIVTEAHHRPRANGSETCSMDFPPNSFLRIGLQGDGSNERILSLTLEKDQCVLAASQALYKGEGFTEDKDSMRKASKSAVRDLLRALVKVGPAKLKGGKRYIWLWERSKRFVVEFAPVPKGSVVSVDGNLICKNTPCSRSLEAGLHEISIQAADYTSKTETVNIGKDSSVKWKLQANFGLLDLTTDPSGVRMLIDGKYAGVTPLRNVKLYPGRHEMEIRDKCFYSRKSSFDIKQGIRQSFAIDADAILGAIDLESINSQSDSVRAKAYIDGKLLGSVPGSYPVSVCAEKLTVKADDYKDYSRRVSIEEKKETKLAVTLEQQPKTPPGYNSKLDPKASVGSNAKNESGLDTNTNLLIAGGTIMGVSLVSILAAGLCFKEMTDIKDGNPNHSRSQYNEYENAGITLFVIGGGSLLVSMVLLFSIDKTKKPKKQSASAYIPMISTDSESVEVSWDWSW